MGQRELNRVTYAKLLETKLFSNIKRNLALDNKQWLVRHKIKPKQTIIFLFPKPFLSEQDLTQGQIYVAFPWFTKDKNCLVCLIIY